MVSILDERKEEIIDWLVRESGSTRLKATIELGLARAITLEAASMPARARGAIMRSDTPGKENFVYRQPLGVVGVISPWNFPLHLSQRSVAPAIALGNAVVTEPASDTPITGGLLLAHIFEEAGLPAGVLSVVIGPGSAIGDQGLYDSFVEEFVAHAGKPIVGDSSAMVGPIINESQLESLRKKIAEARDQGARVLLEGEIPGQIVPPHVFGDVTPDMRLSCDEVFGPLVGIQSARDEQHALELANGTEFGLSSAVFSGDPERGLRFARKIRTGMTHVNDMPVDDEPHMPFGGEKNSGLGRFNGDWAIEEFSTVQWVGVQRPPRPYPF